MARADRLFYIEFYNPVERNSKFPNLRSFVNRSNPRILEQMDRDNIDTAYDVRNIFARHYPKEMYSSSILPLSTVLANRVAVGLYNSRIAGKESRMSEVYIDLTEKNAERLFRWITRGTRDHVINATPRSRLRVDAKPVLAVGWSGGRAYPSATLWSGGILHRRQVYVSGWRPNPFIDKAVQEARSFVSSRLYGKYQQLLVTSIR